MARHEFGCDVNWEMGKNVECTCGADQRDAVEALSQKYADESVEFVRVTKDCEAIIAERDALAAENVRLGHYAILLEGALLRYCAGAYKDIDSAKTISGVDWPAMHVADIERRRTEALKGADDEKPE